MGIMIRHVCIWTTLLFAWLIAGANDSIPESHRLHSSVGVDIRPAYAFSSFRDDILRESLDVDNKKDTKLATSLHLKYGFSFSPTSRQWDLAPGAWQGIGVGMNFFGNNRGLGVPVSLYAFQGAPIWNIGKNLSIYYEWNFGASFGWKPCDGNTAYSNLIVGSKVNAYINLGAGLLWRLGKSYSFTAGIDLTHFSNGNTSFPNPGVNTAGVRIGVTRSFGRNNQAPERREAVDTLWKRKRLGFDITLYGAFRKRVYRGGETPVLLRGRYAVAGIDIAPMWRVAKNFRAGGSVDLQWDESTDLRRNHVEGNTSETILFKRPAYLNQVCMGLSARGELVMPIFSVNVGFGYNILGPEETRATYQLANLKVRLVRGLYLNVGYQLLNFQKQNNLMLGLGYCF